MVTVSVHAHKGLQILLDQNQAACATGLHIQEQASSHTVLFP